MKYKNYYWEESKFFTLKEENRKLISNTNMSPQQIEELFLNWKDLFWNVRGEDYTKWKHYRQPWFIKEKEKEFPFYDYGATCRLVIFDTFEDKQIIRVCGHYRYDDKKCYLSEGGRFLIDPKTRSITDIELPDSRYNHPKTYLPFLDDGCNKIHYQLGGYQSGLHWNNPERTIFIFRKMASGIKPEGVIKSLMKMIFEYDNTVGKNDTWGRTLVRDMEWFVQGGVPEILWKEVPWLKDRLFNAHTFTDSLIDQLSYKYDSLRIAIKHGLFKKVVNTEDLQLWIDTVKMMGRLELDKRNPKFLVPENLREFHDTLVKRINRNTILSKAKAERNQARSLNIKALNQTYAETHQGWLEKIWENENFICKPLQDIKEFLEVGIKMSNCIFSARYYTKETSLICKIIDKTSNSILEIAELSLPGLQILQCSGVSNKLSPRHSEIVEFLKNGK